MKLSVLLKSLMKSPGDTSIGFNPIVLFESGAFKFFSRSLFIRFNQKLKDDIVDTQKSLGYRSL